MWENRETAGCMQTWISKRLMARLIEYRRVINGTRWDSLPRNQVRIKKHPWISNLFPLSKLHPTITLVETYLPLKILPLNLNLKRGERRDARLSLSLFSLRDSIFLLFYKFPLFIFSFRRMKMKRQYLSMNKRGERERGRRKKEEKYTPDSLSSILLPRGARVECHSVQTYPPPSPRHWARLGIVQPEA